VPTADLMATFVFGGLADSVKVYRTENYYYFSFYHNVPHELREWNRSREAAAWRAFPL
jgi:hypothetical protein